MEQSGFMGKVWKLIMGIATVLVCAAGLLSLLAQYTDPETVNYVHLFGLLFPVFFLSFLIFFLVLLLQRSWLATLPLAMIVLSWSTMSAFAPINKQIDQQPQLKLLTYNLHLFYGHSGSGEPVENAGKISSMISQSGADLVFLQEFRAWSENPDKDLNDFIAMCGIEYYRFDPYWEKGNVKKEGMLILSRFPISSGQSVRHDNGRLISQLAQVSLAGKRMLHILNVHLVSFGLANKEIDLVGEGTIADREMFKTHGRTLIGKLNNSFKKRTAEVEMILNEIKSISKTNLIVAGDFNDTPASFTYRELITFGLKDSHRESGRGFISTYAGRLPFLRIDYIFVSRDITTVASGKIPVVLSDHYPYVSGLYINE